MKTNKIGKQIIGGKKSVLKLEWRIAVILFWAWLQLRDLKEKLRANQDKMLRNGNDQDSIYFIFQEPVAFYWQLASWNKRTKLETWATEEADLVKAWREPDKGSCLMLCWKPKSCAQHWGNHIPRARTGICRVFQRRKGKKRRKK